MLLRNFYINTSTQVPTYTQTNALLIGYTDSTHSVKREDGFFLPLKSEYIGIVETPINKRKSKKMYIQFV